MITAAVGSATIDSPAVDPANALVDADRRMYAENGVRSSAAGQGAAVLLRVLTERHPTSASMSTTRSTPLSSKNSSSPSPSRRPGSSTTRLARASLPAVENGVAAE